MKKVIFFELNEVPFRVMDAFCDRHPDSAFARIRPHCHEYITHAEDVGMLEPWVTWPSVHRGVSNAAHQIHDYNQSLHTIDQQYPPIWKILNHRGIKTGIFASLHSYPIPENVLDYAFFIPDPFASESHCHPEMVSDFQNFNLTMSRLSGKNVSSKILVGPALKILRDARKLGLRPSTILDISKQIAHEQLDSKVIVRRRTYQSVLAFDVFMRLLETTKPAFTTFFTNHVASAMHRYWAATFPGDYSADALDVQWQADYSDEIDFSMLKFDQFLQRLVKFVDQNQDYQLLILGSMGQQAMDMPYYTKTLVKIECMSALMQAMGLNDGDWYEKPAMVPQVNVVVDNVKQETFKKALQSFSIDHQPLEYRQDSDGFFSLDFSFPDIVDGQVRILNQVFTLEAVGLKNEILQDGVRVSGWHTPEGALLIYNSPTPKSREYQKVSTLTICPSLLENYGIPVPEYMSDDRLPAFAA